jgi:tripartite-type tricarboxylate transporter receptor subunit TctC
VNNEPPHERRAESRDDDIREETMRLRLVVLGLACLALAGAPDARALDYPTRPVRLVVGFPAGGPTDVLARLVGQRLAERLGQQFVVENKPGAGSNIGTESVVKSAPDGYTILVCASANTINSSLYKRLNFDFARDLAPVAGLARVPNALLVHPTVPARTVPEFIAYAKTNAGKVNMASSGAGTTPHLAGELFKAMAGVDLTHVPYKGSAPAVTDLVGGQVQVWFGDLPTGLPHIRSGAIRALAVTTAARSDVLPDLPPIADTVPGFEASAWFGFVAPKGTSPENVDRLNREINAVLAEPKIKARIAELGSSPMIMTPAEFGAFIASETAKWAKAVALSGARVD